LKRQSVLAKAWAAYVKTGPSDDKFTEGWLAARRAALAKEKLPDAFD
jgi:hypothetical protein